MVTLHYSVIEAACLDEWDAEFGNEWWDAFGHSAVEVEWTPELQAAWMADPLYRRVIGSVLHTGLLPTWPAKLNVSGLDLSNADYRGLRLVGSSFAGCKLTDVSFGSADLRHVSFRGADLRGSWFDNAHLAHADFTNAIVAMVSGLPLNWVADENGIARRVQ